jgi:hypothetical protein
MKELIAMVICLSPLLLGGWFWLGYTASYKQATIIIAAAILITLLIIGWVCFSVYICCKFL